MTTISLSNSVALANDFAVRLLAGLLNVAIDYDTEDLRPTERTCTTQRFSTDIVGYLRSCYSGYQLSRLEATDSAVDPESQWSASEIRTFAVYARVNGNGQDLKIAMFDVFREYLDGDNAEGWTRWNIKNARAYVDGRTFELTQIRLKEDGRDTIWGRALSPASN